MACHRRGLYGKFCDRTTSSDGSHHSIDGMSEGVDGTPQRLCARIKTMAHRGCDGTSINGKCCTQYLIFPNTMGNLQSVNLLMDAKKYSTSFNSHEKLHCSPQIGSRIVFEMQLFFFRIVVEVCFATMHWWNLAKKMRGNKWIFAKCANSPAKEFRQSSG